MNDHELTLRDYIDLFLRRWWIVAATTGVCLLLAVLWSARQTPMYQSSAQILINQASSADIFDPVTGQSFGYATRQAENEARLLNSGLVAEAAIEELGYGGFAVAVVDDAADILIVTAQSSVPAEAQETAQAYAETYLSVRSDQFATQRLATAATLAEELVLIDSQIESATGEELLRLQLRRRELAESSDLLSLAVAVADDGAAQIIDNAYLPGAPFSPNVRRTVALGGLLGLLLGSGAVLMLNALDQSVKSREMLERLTPGAPNLALIPSLGRSTGRVEGLISSRNPNSPGAEAFRTLRAALQYVAVDTDLQVIQIASAHVGAGKTTVASNLAVTLAASGQTVLIIDADLRRPRLHQAFEIAQVPGLSTAIIGAQPLEAVIVPMTHADGPSPMIIPSGPVPPGPAELLGTDAAGEVFAKMRSMADVVIVDTPPVLAVSDAMVLSAHVDASILVVDAKKTTQEEVVRSFERLSQSGAPVVGTVLNRVKSMPSVGYGYGYGYDTGGRGIAGWFGRGVDHLEIERMSGADVPHISNSPRPATVGRGVQTQVAPKQVVVAEQSGAAEIDLTPAANGVASENEAPNFPEEASAWADAVVLRDT